MSPNQPSHLKNTCFWACLLCFKNEIYSNRGIIYLSSHSFFLFGGLLVVLTLEKVQNISAQYILKLCLLGQKRILT